jgi:hypothetical protein
LRNPQTDNNASRPLVLLEFRRLDMFPRTWQSEFGLVHPICHQDQSWAIHGVWGRVPKDVMYFTVRSNFFFVLPKVSERFKLGHWVLWDLLDMAGMWVGKNSGRCGVLGVLLHGFAKIG